MVVTKKLLILCGGERDQKSRSNNLCTYGSARINKRIEKEGVIWVHRNKEENKKK